MNKTVEELVAILQIEKSKRWKRWLRAAGFLFCWAIISETIMLILGVSGNGVIFSSINTLPSLCALGYAFSPSGAEREAAMQLAECDELTAVCPLIKVLNIQNPTVHKATSTALARLLTRAQNPNELGLTRVELNAFNEALQNCNSALFGEHWNTDYVVAVVNIVERVGDEDALKYVERLAVGKTRGEKQARIQSAARESLPVLRSRLERQKAGQRLVRPAGLEVADTLVRPADSGNEIEQTQLLRAVDQ